MSRGAPAQMRPAPHGVGERKRRGLEAAEHGCDRQERGQGLDAAAQPNGFSLPLCSSCALDLAQGVVPLFADKVKVMLEGHQVILRSAQFLLLGVVPVTQLGIVGGVG